MPESGSETWNFRSLCELHLRGKDHENDVLKITVFEKKNWQKRNFAMSDSVVRRVHNSASEIEVILIDDAQCDSFDERGW